VKAPSRYRRSALRARCARTRQLQRLTPAQRGLLEQLKALTPDELELLWWRLEDAVLLERDDVQESLAQLRRGEGVTLAEYRASGT
jgi:hypothetical protein